MSEWTKDQCPECWAQDTLHDSFPEWAYVAPCLEHVVGMPYCLYCGAALNNKLQCLNCEAGKIFSWVDDLRKEAKEAKN